MHDFMSGMTDHWLCHIVPERPVNTLPDWCLDGWIINLERFRSYRIIDRNDFMPDGGNRS